MLTRKYSNVYYKIDLFKRNVRNTTRIGIHERLFFVSNEKFSNALNKTISLGMYSTTRIAGDIYIKKAISESSKEYHTRDSTNYTEFWSYQI